MKKIFIVEDDAILLKMFERIFAAENIEVENATDGADAISKLYVMDIVPSVILLDVMIPVLSGIEVLRLIKESEKLKDIPVLMLSNLTPPRETEESILALGAAMYLHKSQYTPAQIVKKVTDIIQTKVITQDPVAL